MLRRHSYHRLYSGLFLCCCLVLADIAAASEFRRIRDINVACTDNLSCDLFIANPRVALSRVGLRRSAAPDAQLSLFVVARSALDRASSIDVSVDGTLVGSVAVSAFSYRAAISEYVLAEDALARTLVNAAIGGRVLQVDYRTQSGQTTAEFNLEGFVDAVSFMDDLQGRTDRGDGLVDLAEGVAASADAGAVATRLNRYDDIPLAIRSQFFAGTRSSCSGLPDDVRDNLGALAFTIGIARVFVVPCGAPSDATYRYAAFEMTDRGARQLQFPIRAGAALTVQSTVEAVALDAASGRIASVGPDAVERGCGLLFAWEFRTNALGEIALALVEERAPTNCDVPTDPASWPVVWPRND